MPRKKSGRSKAEKSKATAKTFAKSVTTPHGSKHELIRRIYRGRTCDVWEGLTTLASGEQTRCAIKILRKQLVHNRAAVEKLIREGQIGCEITPHHPNLITTREYGEWPDGRPYIVMELIQGPTMRQLKGRIRGNNDGLRYITRELLSVLEYLGSRRLTHGKITPDNILVDIHGRILLGDFGNVTPVADDEPRVDSSQLGALAGPGDKRDLH